MQVGIEFLLFMMLFNRNFFIKIHEITKIDMWFLKQFEELNDLEEKISTYNIKKS